MNYKKIEDVLAVKSEYDQKHKLNTCNKPVPQKWLDKIEEGCSLEQLDQLKKSGFDVFRYFTQITIHGLFPSVSTNRIGGYVNLTQNQNKSIGVRWCGVDREKKSRLFNKLQYVGWRVEDNSQNYGLYMIAEATPDKVSKFKGIAARIDTTLFIGNVDCYVASDLYGRRFVIINVMFRAFYEKNFVKVLENFAGMSTQELDAIIAEVDEKKRKEQEEWEKQWRKEDEERKKRAETAKDDFLRDNPMPEGFVEVTNYKPNIGDIVVRLHNDWNDNYEWVFGVFRKSFGRVILSRCDKDGNIDRDKSGHEAFKEYKSIYVKQ